MVRGTVTMCIPEPARITTRLLWSRLGGTPKAATKSS